MGATGPTGLQAREGREPRCHACGFDLTGLALTGGAVTCPECGACVTRKLAFSTARQRAAVRRQRVTRWLQAPAEPTRARTALRVVITLVLGGLAVAAVVIVLVVVRGVVGRFAGP